MGSTNSQSSDWSSGNGNGNSRNNSPKLGSSYRSRLHDMPNDSQQMYTSGQSSNLKETIPAFALHPSGLHYVPIVIHAYALHRHFNESGFINSVGSCHLISIPVSFGGPFINGQNADLISTVPDNSSSNRHMRKRSKDLSHSSSSSGSSSSLYVGLHDRQLYPMGGIQPPAYSI